MSLSPQQITELCEIVETHIELLNDRLAYFQGDVNGAYFNALVAERDRAKSLLLDVVASSRNIFTVAIKIPDKLVDRN